MTDAFSPEIAEDLDEFDPDGDLFGGLDTTQIGDPFAVDENIYRTVVTEARRDRYVNNEEGKTYYSLIIKFTVDEPTNEFHGMSIQDRHPLFPHVKGDTSQEKWNNMTPEQKRATKFMKLRLRTAFDFTEEEMSTTKPSEYVGRVVYVRTKKGQSKDPEDTRTFTNVVQTWSAEAYAEKYGVSANDQAVNASLDL